MEISMSEKDELQLVIVPGISGDLQISFKGQSSKEDVELFMKAIDSHLEPIENVRRISFDLTEVDPLLNAAGRLLDLACEYHAVKRVPVSIKMPEDIYSVLHEVTPQEVRRPLPFKRTKVRGVTIVIVPAKKLRGGQRGDNESIPVRPRTYALACLGKIRAISGSSITVSLFLETGEVIGEFDRSQFPKVPVQTGMTFDYQVVVTAPGKTEITLEFLTKQQPSDDELVAEADRIAKEIPFEHL
jgi:hypothetical protein